MTFQIWKEKENDKSDLACWRSEIKDTPRLDTFINNHKTFFKIFNVINIFCFILLFICMVYFLISIIYTMYSPMIPVTTILPVKTEYSIDLMDSQQMQEVQNQIANKEQINKYYIYLPLPIFIIALLFITSVHEFSHLIFLRKFNIKVKSYGLGFLRIYKIPIPMLLAFVEQDGEEFLKASQYAKISVASAGVFANLLSYILILLYITIAEVFGFYTVGFFNNLIYIIGLLSISIALGNTIPIIFKSGSGIDGGVISKTIFENRKIFNTNITSYINYIFIGVFIFIMYLSLRSVV